MATFRRKRRRIPWSQQHLLWTILWQFGWVLMGVQADGSSNVEKGSLDVQSFCKANKVKVRKLILLCDSPGAYYYGSNTYRNSRVCMSNDKANMQLSFTVSDRYQGSGNVRVSLQVGIYNHYTTILDDVRLCQLGVTGDNAYRCPKAGDYILKTYFYVPAIRDYDFHYTPDVKLTFYDGEEGYLLGCATTGTMAMHTRANRQAQRGLLALGLCTLITIIIFGGLLYASYRRKKELEQRLREQKTSRYYIQTTANGNVVMDTDDDEEEHHEHGPASRPSVRIKTAIDNNYHAMGQHRHRMMGAEPLHGDESVMDISNPTYNETMVPTRPVI